MSRATGRRGSEVGEHVAVPVAEDQEYVYLATGQVPFELDYGEVLVTLCDVLIEVYTRVAEVVGTPGGCTGAVSEGFGKVDAKVRRLLVVGVVKEWEDAVRGGVKKEVLGVGKEVLGGMM